MQAVSTKPMYSTTEYLAFTIILMLLPAEICLMLGNAKYLHVTITTTNIAPAYNRYVHFQSKGLIA